MEDVYLKAVNALSTRYAFTYRVDKDDLRQDSLIRILRLIERGQLPDGSEELKNLCNVVVYRSAIDLVRKADKSSRKCVQRKKEYSKVKGSLSKALMREATPYEIYSHIDDESFNEDLSGHRRTFSLEESEGRFGLELADPSDTLEQVELLHDLKNILSNLEFEVVSHKLAGESLTSTMKKLGMTFRQMDLLFKNVEKKIATYMDE